MIKKCELCDNTFEINEKYKNERKKRFCSGTCAKRNNGLKNKGRKFSDEVNKKKGRSGKYNHFYGKKHTLETKNKISEMNKWTEDKFKYSNLTDEEMEILDGLMLSDGCLSDTSRISARLTFGFKYKNVCETIINEMESLTFSSIWKSNISNCYHFKSHMFHDLLNESRRWYKDGSKIVPKDVRVTKKSCYWWFIGDGYTLSSTGNVYLCTDSFKREENIFLIEKLKMLGFDTSLMKNNRIRFKKEDSFKFLNWIDDNKIKEYNYKWEKRENV